MTQPRIFPLIMAGGASSRLWPASDHRKPKWALRLFGGRSLLEQAWQRARTVAPASQCFVAAGVAQAALVRRSLPELPPRNLLIEPLPRDTAGAIALAAAAISAQSRDSGDTAPRSKVMLVLPGDHIIEPLSRFKECAVTGARVAVETGALVTFGILPRKAATAYGYVHRGAEIVLPVCHGHVPLRARVARAASSKQRLPVAHGSAPRAFKVLGFREKPDQQTADHYLASGDYYWNGGIFLWTLDTLLAEFERQLPGHAAFARDLGAVPLRGRKWDALLRARFPELTKISIDFGMMEHAALVATVAADFEWDDIGSWSAVADHLDRSTGNAVGPATETLPVGAQGNVVFAPGKRVALVGVDGLAVVVSDNDVLVCRLDRDQDVRKVSEAVAARNAVCHGHVPLRARARRSQSGTGSQQQTEAARGTRR